MELFASWFDAEVRGLERVPEKGPVLLVGNHSGGLLVPDTSALFAAWYRHFGLERPLLGLAFDALFSVPGLKDLMRRLGEIPASPENAEAALAKGAALLVYPGGAHETFRPWSDRNLIDFGGHSGFVKLALRRRACRWCRWWDTEVTSRPWCSGGANGSRSSSASGACA